MSDRDDENLGWNDEDDAISSTGKEHDPFGSDGSESHFVSNASDDTSFDDGEGDLCPDYENDET
jgi:hypothetical protein